MNFLIQYCIMHLRNSFELMGFLHRKVIQTGLLSYSKHIACKLPRAVVSMLILLWQGAIFKVMNTVNIDVVRYHSLQVTLIGTISNVIYPQLLKPAISVSCISPDLLSEIALCWTICRECHSVKTYSSDHLAETYIKLNCRHCKLCH